MAAGIYLHIPFCLKKCPYCDFYSLPFRPETAERYIDALAAQIRQFSGFSADSVYFGGGTPSLLSEGQLARIFSVLSAAFSLSPDCEITLEINPATARSDKLRAFRSMGVNRLSVGVQSLLPRALAALGRPHTAEDALRTIDLAAESGFDNISADLMLGIPFLTEDAIGQEIGRLAAGGVRHISAYLLKIMAGTPFAAAPPPEDEDRDVRQYLFAASALRRQGYRQYEISNFARPGARCRHNLKYWNLRDYIGFGPAAHTLLAGTRYSFPPDTAAYLARFPEDPPADPLSALTVEGKIDPDDYIMMRLRLTGGLSLSRLSRRFGTVLGESAKKKLRRFREAGLLRFDGETVRLTAAGFLVSNEIIASILTDISKK